MATFQLVTCYASSYLQENQSFIFHNHLYQVERRLIKMAEEIFRNLIVQTTVVNRKYRTLPKLGVEDFSPNQLNFILHFFKFGKLKESSIDSEMTLNLRLTCFRYNLSLFENYLTEKLTLKDQLELAAIQQDEKEFFKIINKLFTPGKALSKEMLCVVNHFEPAKFEELMVNLICPYSSELSSALIQIYFSERQESVENFLYRFQNQSFKFQCMGEISHLNKRQLWFQHFWAKIPVELIRKAIIQPFIDLHCIPQAKEWTIKIKDSSSAVILLSKSKECCAKRQIGTWCSLQETQPSLLSGSNNNNSGEVDVVCQDLQSLLLDSSDIAVVSIPEAIQKAIDKHFSRIILKDADSVKKCLLQMIESNSAIPIKWNVEVLLGAMRCYMQKIIYHYHHEILSDIKKAHVPVRPHEKHLHPALQENYEILYRLLPFIKRILVEEFKNACFFQIIEENPKIFDSHFLLSEIISMVRYLYCQDFSLQEDFVIQSVAQELQPYLIGQIKTAPLQSTEPFLQRLEESFKQAGLGAALSPSHIELAISIYIQKGVESVNFRNFFVQDRKFNIYWTSDNCGNPFLKMIPALESALKRDFPLKEVELKTPQMVKFFTNRAELIREVFIKSQQAYYRIVTLERVKYTPYSPNQKKDEIHD